MEKKKESKQLPPKSGIFYMIPYPKKPGTYTIYSELQEEGEEDVAHLFLFEKVRMVLEARFKISLGEMFDAYTGIPRGRILEPKGKNGDWIVTHGEDFSLYKYHDVIISDFFLKDALEAGKVRFEVDPHEKMDPEDRKQVESQLGIRFTASGWKNKSIYSRLR